MPVSIDVIAVKNIAVNEYEQSNDFNKDNSLIHQLQSSDGSKLYIYDKNRCIRIQDIDPDNYLWINFDDELDFAVNGDWADIPFDIKANCRMSLIIDQNDQDLTNELIQHFTEISKDFLTFDTSKSFETTFIAVFKPDLQELVNYRDVIDNMFNEFAALDEFFIDPDNIAYSTFFTLDAGIYDKLTAYGVDNIEHYLNLSIYGLTNQNSIDWQGELYLSGKDIKIV